MTADDIRNLKALLHRMRAEDLDFRVFGSDHHRYRLGPPLAESELQAFERLHQVTLPADYRFFLHEIGDGGATRSSAPILAVNAGAGPGCGLFPLAEAALACDLSRPFPVTEPAEVQHVPGIDRWGDEEPYPGVLEIAYHGCAFFSYLVVNGPAYGTVWDADVDLRNFTPTGLAFDVWYRRWLDMLIEKALPVLAHERVVEQITVGMTKSQVIGICGGRWQQTDLVEQHSFLRFEQLATEFELDENDMIVRMVRHRI